MNIMIIMGNFNNKIKYVIFVIKIYNFNKLLKFQI